MKPKSRPGYGSFHFSRLLTPRLLKSWAAVESPPLPMRFSTVARPAIAAVIPIRTVIARDAAA